MFDKITVQSTNEGGFPMPTFILHTTNIEKAANILKVFPLMLMPVNVVAMRQLPNQSGFVTSPSTRLKIEFSLDDPSPGSIVGDVELDGKLCDELEVLNEKSRSISVILKEKNKGIFAKVRTMPIPGVYENYLLDWKGIRGVIFYVRTSRSKSNLEGETPVDRRKLAENWMDVLKIRIEDNGDATGLYTELGYLYRLQEDWQQAIDCYLREIRFGLKADGLPGIGVLIALNNLGIVYKKIGDITAAQACFALALAVNPNYFEALVSAVGVTTNENLCINYLARATVIRPDFEMWPQLFINAAYGLDISQDTLIELVNQTRPQIDLASQQFTIDSLAALQRIGL